MEGASGLLIQLLSPEPVFVNISGAQKSISGYRFRQPLKPGGPVRQIGLLYRPARMESIPGLLKSLQIQAQDIKYNAT